MSVRCTRAAFTHAAARCNNLPTTTSALLAHGSANPRQAGWNQFNQEYLRLRVELENKELEYHISRLNSITVAGSVIAGFAFTALVELTISVDTVDKLRASGYIYLEFIYYLSIGSILRPFRAALALAVTPKVDATWTRIQERLKVPRAVAIGIFVAVFNVIGAFVLLYAAVSGFCLALRVPPLP